MSTSQKVITHLEAKYGNQIKKHGNTYRCPSPLRPESDSPSFALTINDDEHGFFKDFVNEESGSLYTLAAKLGIDTPTTTAPSRPSKTAHDSLADYARAHGVEQSVFEAAGWQQTTYHKRPALSFPTKTGTRYRFIDGAPKKAKYTHASGYQSCWYGLAKAAVSAVANNLPLVYCNGEPSVVTAQAFGLPAICITGGAEREIPSALLDELKSTTKDFNPEIVIVMDSDPKGLQAAQKIQTQLTTAGLKARAVDLNLWDKGDLADFCKLHTDDAMTILNDLPTLTDNAVQEATNSKVPWKVWGDIDAFLNLPPVEWLIDGLVQKDALGMVFGDPGIGKSFYVLDLSLILGNAGYNVVYNISEDERGFAERIRAWCYHHKLPPKITPVSGTVPFLDETLREIFMESLGRSKPDVIVIDTVARSMLGGDENSARDVGQYIHFCEELRHRFGCTIILVHHTNKGGLQERGSSSFRGAVNFIIRLTEDDGLIAVTSSKSRSAAKTKATHKRLLPVKFNDPKGREIESAVIVDADKVEQTESDPLTPTQEQVLSLLSINIYEDGASRGEIAADLPTMPNSTLTYTLAKLKKFGYIDQPNRGRYQISDIGLAKIGKNREVMPTMPNNANNANMLTNANEKKVMPTEFGISILALDQKQPENMPLMPLSLPEIATKMGYKAVTATFLDEAKKHVKHGQQWRYVHLNEPDKNWSIDPQDLKAALDAFYGNQSA